MDNNKKPGFNVNLQIEQNICFKRNKIVKFDKFKVNFEYFENLSSFILNMLHAYHKCCANGTCNVFLWQSSRNHQII